MLQNKSETYSLKLTGRPHNIKRTFTNTLNLRKSYVHHSYNIYSHTILYNLCILFPLINKSRYAPGSCCSVGLNCLTHMQYILSFTIL